MRTIAIPLVFATANFAACGWLPEQHEEAGQTPHASGKPTADPKQPPKPAPSDEAWVRATIQKLMDVPRTVPAAGGRPSEVRGGPGSFGKLSHEQVDEIVAATVYAGNLFMPSSLPPQLKYALILVDMSAESAFRMETCMPNGANVSVGLQQVTIPTWSDLFRQRAHIPGLHHYDGSRWDIAKTDANKIRSSLWDGVVVANWAMSEMAKAGGSNPRSAEFHEGGDGPMPKTVKTMWLAWNSGYPRARQNPPTNEYLFYESMIVTDLKLLGLPASLLDTHF